MCSENVVPRFLFTFSEDTCRGELHAQSSDFKKEVERCLAKLAKTKFPPLGECGLGGVGASGVRNSVPTFDRGMGKEPV